MEAAFTCGIVETSNAQRYLQQLCRHWQHKLAVTVEYDRASITMRSGDNVALQASATGLTIEIEANPETLAQTRDVVVDHIDRFAFREGPLHYSWR